MDNSQEKSPTVDRVQGSELLRAFPMRRTRGAVGLFDSAFALISEGDN